jgi:dTDP-4-amino-4,6-dideoxygalactose transaminase
LRAADIEAQIGTWALHRLAPYREQGAFPGADRAFERALALPFAATTTEDEVDRVAEVLTTL